MKRIIETNRNRGNRPPGHLDVRLEAEGEFEAVGLQLVSH